MLAERFQDDLQNIWPSGLTLTLEEQQNLEIEMLKIQHSEDFDEVLLWGKIQGINADYLICMGLDYRGSYEFAHKRYFWTTNRIWTFAELPAINPNDRENVESQNSLFLGNPNSVIVEPKEDEEEEKQSDDDQEKDTDSVDQEKVPQKSFTELDRLAFVVRAIDQDCSVVPKGAFRMTPAHEIMRNANFEGLKRDEVLHLGNFQHFRNVQLKEKREQLDHDDALFSIDFLDNIDKDLPRGSWSLQLDPTSQLCIIRSLLWIGYVAYAKINSKHFGGIYIGDGIKNADLPFMVPYS